MMATDFRAFTDVAARPFVDANCFAAARAAFPRSKKVARLDALARECGVSGAVVPRVARALARDAGLFATDTTPASGKAGLAVIAGEYVCAVSTEGAWWARATGGAVRVTPAHIVCAWVIDG